VLQLALLVGFQELEKLGKKARGHGSAGGKHQRRGGEHQKQLLAQVSSNDEHARSTHVP
jgi:hypothetical protein